MTDSVVSDKLIPRTFITSDREITDRALRKQIRSNRFPPPDANINGRNYWLTSTYLKWKEAALAGKFAKVSRLSAGGRALEQRGMSKTDVDSEAGVPTTTHGRNQRNLASASVARDRKKPRKHS